MNYYHKTFSCAIIVIFFEQPDNWLGFKDWEKQALYFHSSYQWSIRHRVYFLSYFLSEHHTHVISTYFVVGLNSLLTFPPQPGLCTCGSIDSGNGPGQPKVWPGLGVAWLEWRELGIIQLLSVGYSLQSSQGIGGSGSVSWRSIIGDLQGGNECDWFLLWTVIYLPRYG